ncbi:hypothetical protein ATCC90586_009130 [Pythium insidiosum]|nr:hypothetical protein ATCC90586_009130 [Pythium insidiosum]
MGDHAGRRRPPNAGARSPPHYAASPSHQAQLKQQQQQQQQAAGYGAAAGRFPNASNNPTMATNSSNSFRGAPMTNTPRGGASTAKLGIKSGMTVEDLKRLTQQRIQQQQQQQTTTTAAAGAATGSAADAGAAPPAQQRPVTPTHNMAAVNTAASGAAASSATATPTATATVPKAGMSVQELKQLTSLRLASQSVPLHQSEITGLVSKAVLSNAAKSHYRESLRGGPLTPTTTTKPQHQQSQPQQQQQRVSMTRTANGAAIPGDGALGGRHSLPSRPMGVPPMDRHNSPEFAPQQHPQLSHQQQHALQQQQQRPYHRYSYSGPEDLGSLDAMNGYSNSSQDTDTQTRPSLDLDDDVKYGYDDAFKSLQFPDDAFPPPPPLDSFVATSLPSWSPPPARAKKLDTVAPPPVPMAFYAPQPAADAADQNAIIAPPPGLSRRPSMTVPWQVAEAVLNTPQTTSGRKTLLSPKAGLKSPAAEAAAELGALALGRQRSTNAGLPLSTPPPTSSGRRGSFGNAAEFFKFRRRSKSRLELARDLATYAQESSGTSASGYGTMSTLLMPGIDERHDNMSVVAHAADSSDDDDDDDDATTAYVRDPDELFNDSGSVGAGGGGGSFISFYDATRARADSLDGLSQLSIPPPPPPPLTDDDDDDASTTSSSKGLPMMSPNGVRLRKVAELARRGSLSSEDKTRVKDEIIQSSLGLGASHAARILTSAGPKPGLGVPAPAPAPSPAGSSSAVERPPVSPSVVAMPAPPPGFSRLSSGAGSTPREAKALGIVRSTSTGVASRSPPKPSPLMPTQQRKTVAAESSSLEERLAAAAQRVADCVSKGDMVGFQTAMDELDVLRTEASARLGGAMRG